MGDDVNGSKKRAKLNGGSSKKFLRSDLAAFDWDHLCCICRQSKNKGEKKLYRCSDTKIIASMITACELTNNSMVRDRLKNIMSLKSLVNIGYHNRCNLDLNNKKRIILSKKSKSTKPNPLEKQLYGNGESNCFEIGNVESIRKLKYYW